MTTKVRRFGSALALVMAAAGGALAQPGQEAGGGEERTVAPQGPADGSVLVVAPAPAPGQPAQPQAVVVVAPHNENWSNVSHINGQLVPVGQRGDYLVKDRTTSISTNPIGWIVGVYGLSVEHAIGKNVALRGDVNISHIDNEDGYEVGVSVPIYLKRMFSGPFLEPGLIARDMNTGDDQSGLVGPEVLVGWHWTFDSGLNMAAAVGVARNVSPQTESCYDDGYCYDDYQSEVEPAGYFRIGYAY